MASSNSGASASHNPLLAAVSAVSSSTGADPRPMQKSSFSQGINYGPGETASMISGVKTGGKREDDGPYFTNNDGHPFPDP